MFALYSDLTRLRKHQRMYEKAEGSTPENYWEDSFVLVFATPLVMFAGELTRSLGVLFASLSAILASGAWHSLFIAGSD